MCLLNHYKWKTKNALLDHIAGNNKQQLTSLQMWIFNGNSLYLTSLITLQLASYTDVFHFLLWIRNVFSSCFMHMEKSNILCNDYCAYSDHRLLAAVQKPFGENDSSTTKEKTKPTNICLDSVFQLLYLYISWKTWSVFV